MDSDSDSDDDNDDDDADMVVPYDSSRHPRPKLPIYHPGFQVTKELSKEVLQVVVSFLQATRDSGYRDNEITSLWNEVVKAKKSPEEPEVRIAITGDTGTGKSATLNSLLGVDNLTPEVSACPMRSGRLVPNTDAWTGRQWWSRHERRHGVHGEDIARDETSKRPCGILLLGTIRKSYKEMVRSLVRSRAEARR